MADPLPVMLRHLASAEEDRCVHLARGNKGNLEAMLAGHKSAWLVDLIREICGREAANEAIRIREEKRRGI